MANSSNKYISVTFISKNLNWHKFHGLFVFCWIRVGFLNERVNNWMKVFPLGNVVLLSITRDQWLQM